MEYKNICERYGSDEVVTIEDYQELNPDGDFEVDGNEIIEVFSNDPGDFEVIARR